MKCGLKAKGLLAPAFAVAMTVSVGAFLLSINVKADPLEQVNLTIPSACTMSGSGSGSHTASTQGNNYTEGIGTTTLQAFCNDSAGFAIYAIGYTDNEMGKTVLTDSSLGNTYDIASGTATSGGTSNWAMKLAITQDANDTTNNPFTLDNGFGDYSVVPNAYTKVAHKDTSTDMTSVTGGVKLTTTYAAFASATQPAGTYTGQVKYTLVHPASEMPQEPHDTVPGYIAYYPNASTAVGSMSTDTGGPAQQLTDSQTSATLIPSNFSREGYGFAGWNTEYDYSGTFYGPSEDITFTAGQYTGENKGLSLYAVWVESAGSLQSDAASVCSGLTQAPVSGTVTMASVSALTDQRDGQTYAIAKLADGKCWMIENLRLENTATDNSSGSLSQGYNTGFIGLADSESDNFVSSSTTNSLYTIENGVVGKSTITGSYQGYRFPRYNHINTGTRATSLTASTSYTTTANANIYSYGNYYSWAAAIADISYYGIDNESVVNNSLCPTGWHLPTGGRAYPSSSDSGVNVTGDPSTFREFYNLGYKVMDNTTAFEDTVSSIDAYYSDKTVNTNGNTASEAFRKFPNNFLYSGEFEASWTSERGEIGSYWSSTANNGGSSYGVGINDLYLVPASSFAGKYYGFSIRCIIDS